LRRDATSDVEDFIVKMSAYFDDDFGSLIKERKDAVDKLKRHCNRLISKYAS